ncbi:MAG: hypothetical protein M3X11_03070 [Acidobacteriota bacterium]|nr:hypothetical protein [Acidobacteriota bacterium]
MNRLYVLVAIVCLLAIHPIAQDPVKVAPQNYKLEFENEWVKVLRVHYGAKEKIPEHDHPATGAAYVYLNDSGPIIFKHVGLGYGAVTRPATKAGSFRLYKATKETHEVENASDTHSDFLRVEFRTEPIGDKKLHGKFYREDVLAGENFQKVQFENEQIRVVRLICAPGKTLSLSASSPEPALLVALSAAKFKIQESKNKSATLDIGLGQTRWPAEGSQAAWENTGAAPVELLRFDFKTRPVKKSEEKPHDHQHN